MQNRDPLHDRIDTQLVHRLIANMKERHVETLPLATLEHDMRLVEDEVAFAEQRIGVLKERCALPVSRSNSHAHRQIFADLLQETEAELYRLYNARQFLTAEKLMKNGMPGEHIAALLQSGTLP